MMTAVFMFQNNQLFPAIISIIVPLYAVSLYLYDLIFYIVQLAGVRLIRFHLVESEMLLFQSLSSLYVINSNC